MKTIHILILALLCAFSSNADTITLYPSADMFLGTSYNTTAQNTSNLKIGGWGDTYYTFIKFDMNQIPQGVTITSATMWLLPNQTLNAKLAPVTSANLWFLTTPWNETTTKITDNLSGYNLGAFNLSTTYGASLDFTNYVNLWRNGTYTNQGFLLQPNQTSNNFFYFSSRESGDTNRPRLTVDYVQGFKIGFPGKDLNGNVVSPYSVSVESIMDNDPRIGYFQTSDGQTSTQFEKNFGLSMAKSNWNRSNLPFQYNFRVNGVSRYDLLAYDNHDGYDFALQGKFIAPADGIVYAGSIYTSYNGGIWRNPSFVTPSGQNLWEGFHAIYIDHGNGYVTYAYHCSDFVPSIKQSIIKQGYCIIKKGEEVGTIGGFMNYSPTGAPTHLHFGVSKDRQLVDPYGNWRGGNVLWDK